MTDIDARLDRVLAAIQQPGPVDDSPGGYERDDDPPAWWDEQRGVERMEDDYERALDRRWE